MIQVLKREGGVWGGGGEARREQQEAWLLESTFRYWLSLLHGKERGGMERKEPVDWLACLCSQSPGSWFWSEHPKEEQVASRKLAWRTNGSCSVLLALPPNPPLLLWEGSIRLCCVWAGLAVGSHEAPGCNTSCPSEGLLVSGSVEGCEGGCTSGEGLAFLPIVPPAGTQASPHRALGG